MNKQLQNIIKVNDEIYPFITSFLNSYSGQKFDVLFIQYFTLNIFHRLILYQKAIRPLLNEIESNSFLEFPLGIILRPGCLDVMYFGYVYSILDNVKIDEINPKETVIPDYSILQSTLQSIYSENINNYQKDMKALKSVGIIKDIEYNEIIKNVNSQYEFLLQNNSKHLSLTVRKIFNILKQNKKYDLFSNIFLEYAYYSKLEHFGIFFCDLTTTKPIQKHLSDNDLIIQRIKSILMAFINVYHIGFILFGRPENETKQIDRWFYLLNEE